VVKIRCLDYPEEPRPPIAPGHLVTGKVAGEGSVGKEKVFPKMTNNKAFFVSLISGFVNAYIAYTFFSKSFVFNPRCPGRSNSSLYRQ
jgi:hypothetical protein